MANKAKTKKAKPTLAKRLAKKVARLQEEYSYAEETIELMQAVICGLFDKMQQHNVPITAYDLDNLAYFIDLEAMGLKSA